VWFFSRWTPTFAPLPLLAPPLITIMTVGGCRPYCKGGGRRQEGGGGGRISAATGRRQLTASGSSPVWPRGRRCSPFARRRPLAAASLCLSCHTSSPKPFLAPPISLPGARLADFLPLAGAASLAAVHAHFRLLAGPIVTGASRGGWWPAGLWRRRQSIGALNSEAGGGGWARASWRLARRRRARAAQLLCGLGGRRPSKGCACGSRANQRPPDWPAPVARYCTLIIVIAPASPEGGPRRACSAPWTRGA